MALAAFSMVLIHSTVLMLEMLIEVGVPMCVTGHSIPGEYPWHTSSFCQRWKMQSSIISAAGRKKDAFEQLGGSWWLSYRLRCEGAQVGADCCLWPWGQRTRVVDAHLLSIGDGACIDDAGVTTHLNTRGMFSLGPVLIGERSTIRYGSRIQMNSVVGQDSLVLEHSLVMSGEQVNDSFAWFGFPLQWQAKLKT